MRARKRRHAGDGLRLARALLAALLVSCTEDVSSSDYELALLGPRLAVWIPDSTASILHTDNGGYFYAAARLVVRDSLTWRAVWLQAQGSTVPAQPVPVVDFEVDRLLVAALGSRATGGYWITIDSVTLHEYGAVAHVTRAAPGPSCFVTGAETQPLHVIRMPRLRELVVFRDRDRVIQC